MNDRDRSTRRPGIWTLGMAIVILVASLAGGIFGDRLLGDSLEDKFQNRLKEYTDLLSAVSYWSADEVESKDLVYSSIEGMLRTLDPHTAFLEPRDYAEMQERQKGTFYGLGILVTKRNSQVTVITPLEGTPASRLGIRAGDIISEVEGEPTEDLALDEVVQRLKGPKGTTVNIKIVRVGMNEPIPLSIVREAIPTNSISNVLMVRPGVGYIRIKDFTYTTVRELSEALETLEGQGMERLILDLRMNPGGLLEAAVGVSDFFVDKGDMIVYHKGRNEETYQEYRAPGRQETRDYPLVILINRESASASEIVAGAIQDHDRGLVVGQTSWGKGLVQSVYSLQYGAGLALTTSKYYTPSGRNIQRDYSSFYDYYLGEPEGAEYESDEIFRTDTGRKVYGGGGITPDVVVTPRELPRVIQLLQVRSAFFNYAVRYVANHPGVTEKVEIDETIIDEFVAYAAEQEVASVEEIREALAEPANLEYLESMLKAEIIAARYDYNTSYPWRLRGDVQVERAIELLPEAAKLASRADAARSEHVASNRPVDGGGAVAGD